MSADKRSTHTDALATLGTIIGDSEARDAIHLAVEPVEAAEHLWAGAHVGLLPDGRASTNAVKKLGIVDPFLEEGVRKGSKFWLIVYPRQITSLRHVWEHPDFKPEGFVPVVTDELKVLKARALVGDKEAQQELDIRDFANDYDMSVEELLTAATDYLEHGDYLCRGGDFEGVNLPDGFWDYYDRVNNTTTDDDDRHSFFTCSC